VNQVSTPKSKEDGGEQKRNQKVPGPVIDKKNLSNKDYLHRIEEQANKAEEAQFTSFGSDQPSH